MFWRRWLILSIMHVSATKFAVLCSLSNVARGTLTATNVPVDDSEKPTLSARNPSKTFPKYNGLWLHDSVW